VLLEEKIHELFHSELMSVQKEILGVRRQLSQQTLDEDDEERSQRRCELMVKVYFSVGQF